MNANVMSIDIRDIQKAGNTQQSIPLNSKGLLYLLDFQDS